MGGDRRRLLRALAAGALLAALAGCGSAPGTVGPSGVDGLVVPTPSPDRADFVAVVDNPWLPLTPGARWVRRVADGGPEVTERVEVLREGREVAGVTATGVRTTRSDGSRTLASRVEWYAQDRAGNVWLLGEQGVWEAGVAGARAGLAMARHPRRGDGHVLAALPGDQDRVRRVGERGASVTVAAGRFTELLAVVETTTGASGETELFYAEGVGEVLRVEADGSRVELVEHLPGD